MIYREAIRDMDANKHQKHDEGFDCLPNELLQEIIWNLPIEETIQTCFMSQRWRAFQQLSWNFLRSILGYIIYEGEFSRK